MAFRSDLEERVQALAIDRHRRQRQHDLSMASWRETLASKQSHTAMLCSLVHEAHRQHPANIPTVVVKALLHYVLCSQLGLDPAVDAAQSPLTKQNRSLPAVPTGGRATEDRYVTLLEKLSKLDLFRRVHTVQTLQDAGIPVNIVAMPKVKMSKAVIKQHNEVTEEEEDELQLPPPEDVAAQRARSSLERLTMMKQSL